MLVKPFSGALSTVVFLRRAALTPFMANNSLGADSYKWILYGDDDTVSFMDAGLGLLEHANSMAAIHSAHHSVLPEMCLAVTVLVEDFLRQRCQCCWLAEASCPSQVCVYDPSHCPASWAALRLCCTSRTILLLWVPPGRVPLPCRSSLWTTPSSSWSTWTLTCPTSSATTSGSRRDGWPVGAVLLCAAQSMQGSHCMADHACCCPLQLLRVPRLSDGLSASHLLLATTKEPDRPLASLPACLHRGRRKCAGHLTLCPCSCLHRLFVSPSWWPLAADCLPAFLLLAELAWQHHG